VSGVHWVPVNDVIICFTTLPQSDLSGSGQQCSSSSLVVAPFLQQTTSGL